LVTPGRHHHRRSILQPPESEQAELKNPQTTPRCLAAGSQIFSDGAASRILTNDLVNVCKRVDSCCHRSPRMLSVTCGVVRHGRLALLSHPGVWPRFHSGSVHSRPRVIPCRSCREQKAPWVFRRSPLTTTSFAGACCCQTSSQIGTAPPWVHRPQLRRRLCWKKGVTCSLNLPSPRWPIGGLWPRSERSADPLPYTDAPSPPA